MQKKKRWVFILLIVILVLLALTLFLTFGFTKKCSSKDCFDSALSKCSRVGYADDSGDVTWKYKIYGENIIWNKIKGLLGVKESVCEVNVKLFQVKAGNLELEKGAGLDMDCSLPYGIVMPPQADTSKCHGLLREFLQEEVIQKLHAYIIENLGEIEEELSKVV